MSDVATGLSADQALILLSERQQELYNAIRLSVQEAVGRAWDAFGNVDDAAMTRFVEAVAPVVEAGRAQVADLTRSMVLQALEVAGEGDVVTAMAALDATPIAYRGGVPVATVYERPVVEMRTLLSQGKDWAVAKARARSRAVSAASIDVATAQRDAMDAAALDAQRATGRNRIVGYRRTLTGVSCRFCATASTQRYYPHPLTGGDPHLMPLHNHCDCGVAPIIGSRDPGQIINRDLLDRLKAEGPNYWQRAGYVDPDGNPISPTELVKKKVDIAEHGELGTVFGTDVTPDKSLADRIAGDRARARELLDDKSSLIDPSGAPSAEGRELLDATKAVGAEVRAEADRLAPDLPRKKAAASAANADAEAARKASNDVADELKAFETDFYDRYSVEQYGKPYFELPYSEKSKVKLAIFDDKDYGDLRIRLADARTAASQAEAVARELAADAFVTERDAIFSALCTLRSTGSPTDLRFKVKARSGESLAVQNAIADATNWYPEDWTTTLGQTRIIKHSKVQRGFQRDNRDGTIDIALSDSAYKLIATDVGKYGRVAVHELAHAVESTNPDVTTLEWLFFRTRTDGTPVKYVDGLPAYLDDFPELYFGKSYGSGLTSHKELISMSMDTLVGGRFGQKPMDDDHLAWLLGTWVVG